MSTADRKHGVPVIEGIIHPELEDILLELIAWVDDQELAEAKASAAGTSIRMLMDAVRVLSGRRKAAVRRMIAQGRTMQEIGKMLGFTRQRVQQMVDG